MFTAAEKLKCVQRELQLRRVVYARRVAEKKMSETSSKREIALMEAIVEDYLKQAEQEKLL